MEYCSICFFSFVIIQNQNFILPNVSPIDENTFDLHAKIFIFYAYFIWTGL